MLTRRRWLVGVAAVGVAGAVRGMAAAGEEIPLDARVMPPDLPKMLRGGARPLVLQVGSKVMFDGGHIPGAVYAGPGSQLAGLEVLRFRMKDEPKDRAVVLYCGCCPWEKCPNMRPAFAEMRKLAFTGVKALYIATDFGTDWVDKGYPVEASPNAAYGGKSR